jgi:hypothetical protein
VGGAEVRFDVKLHGRTARLSLARPVETAYVRLLRLESELAPITSSVFDLRAGARAFRHRRGEVRAAEAEIFLGEALKGPARSGIDSALAGRSAEGLRFEVIGRDVRLVGADARALACPPSSPPIEVRGEACLLRDPLGWSLREALMPSGFRAPRVLAGHLTATIHGGSLRLRLEADAERRAGADATNTERCASADATNEAERCASADANKARSEA